MPRPSHLSSSSSKVCPLYSGFPSPKTKFRHLSLSLVSSSVCPWFAMLRLTPSIHLSLGLTLRVPSGFHSKIFSGSLFPGILFTCPNHRSRFYSVTSKMLFPTSMISLMVTLQNFSFLICLDLIILYQGFSTGIPPEIVIEKNKHRLLNLLAKINRSTEKNIILYSR
jgi:hypothetical protein